MEREKLELYLHIPFCVKKCAYCDFLSFPCDCKTQRRYVEKLVEEIEKVSANCQKYAVSSIFVGGGTPSVIDSKWIVEIFDCLRECFAVEPNAEISMEANPGTLTREKLSDYRKAGINRLSIGLQSTDNKELSLLGRIHTYEGFLESYRLARECGFTNINVDLMSALPGQTVDSWLKTLQNVVDLGPEHISAYSLIIEEGTPFFEKYGETDGEAGENLGEPDKTGGDHDMPAFPDEGTDREIYHRTKEFLKAHGYERYEISNYAKPGHACRHNIGYWTDVPYLGIGLGASSYMNGKRFSNTYDLKEYLNGAAGDYRDIQILDEKDKQEEFFFVGLRMIDGVSLDEFERRFGVPAENVYPGLMERFVREGVAEIIDGKFRLTDYGLDVSNYVMAEFLQT